MDSVSYDVEFRTARYTGDTTEMSDWIFDNEYSSADAAEDAAEFLYTVYRHVRVVTRTNTTEYREL